MTSWANHAQMTTANHARPRAQTPWPFPLARGNDPIITGEPQRDPSSTGTPSLTVGARDETDQHRPALYHEVGTAMIDTDTHCDVTNRPIVVYDGDCRFCRHQIDRIRRWDRSNQFEYLPKQTPGLEDQYPALASGDFNTGMRLIVPGEEPAVVLFVGADAVYQIARRLPRWRWVAWVYRVPVIHGLAVWAYAWIAARRQTLGKSCDDGACRVDT